MLNVALYSDAGWLVVEGKSARGGTARLYFNCLDDLVAWCDAVRDAGRMLQQGVTVGVVRGE